MTTSKKGELEVIYTQTYAAPPLPRLTDEGTADDLKGELQQVLWDGCDPGKGQFLRVSMICVEDVDLLLAAFQHHCTVPVVITCSEAGRGGGEN